MFLHCLKNLGDDLFSKDRTVVVQDFRYLLPCKAEPELESSLCMLSVA